MAILARNHAHVLTRASFPGDPEDHQARYIEEAVQGVLTTSVDPPNGNPQPGPKFNYSQWHISQKQISGKLRIADEHCLGIGAFRLASRVKEQDIYASRKSGEILAP